MANIDSGRRRVSAVLLVCGAEGSGRTTSLYTLARQLPAGSHGKVVPLPGAGERFLKLDYRPHEDLLVRGYQVTFRIISVSGKSDPEFLKGIVGAVDGVLLVADSSPTASESNMDSLTELESVVTASGRSLSDFPRVLLYNKRDLQDAVAIEELQTQLNSDGAPYVSASALRGQGVLDGLERLTTEVAVLIRQEVSAIPDSEAEGGTSRTTPFGMTLDSARAMYGDDPSAAGEDDRTFVPGQSPARPVPDWNTEDDDRTDVNGGPAHPAMAPSDTEDRTSPPAPRQSSSEVVRPPSEALWTSPSMTAVPSMSASGQTAVSGRPEASSHPAWSRGRDSARRPASQPPESRTDKGTPAPPVPAAPAPPVPAAPSPPVPASPSVAGGAGTEGQPSPERRLKQADSSPAPPRSSVFEEPGPPQDWEGEIRPRAIRVPVPELEGYEISRIGTPTSMSPLLLRVPLQAKHPYGSEVEDFVIDIEMREGRLMRRDPIRPARRPPSETPEVDDLWVEEGRRLPWGLFFWGLVALCGTVIVISFLLSLS